MKGEKCDYLHQYDPNKMPECTLWLKSGKCNDPDCNFRHVEASERPECQRYRRGFCKFGPMCRSRHDRLPRQSIPDVLPDWFLDALVHNFHLVPKQEDVPDHVRREQLRNGSSGSHLAIMPAIDFGGTVPGLIPPINGKCRFFTMRSVNMKNVQISAAKGIWATSHGNAQRLRQSFRDVDHVILIFAATESRNFLGYAKMLAEPDDRLYPGIWGDMSSRLSANMRVHWIKQCAVPVGQADHIKNPNNENLPVRRCRDGQDLATTCGEVFCRFLWQQPTIDICQGSELEFEPRFTYDPSTALALTDQGGDQSTSAGGSERGKVPSPAALALEDGKKDDSRRDADDGRSRPAPVRMGTFTSDGSWKMVHGTNQGSSAVTVGKALASGSSSLLAAVTEDAHRHGQQLHMGWPGHPPPGWRPPPMPGYGYPPPAYYPPHAFAGALPPFDPRMAPPRPGEAMPPGFWAGAAPSAGSAHFSQPPDGWEGASGAAQGTSREDRGRRGRSRSRSRGRHRKRR